jgi:putative DNA primase/helicase
VFEQIDSTPAPPASSSASSTASSSVRVEDLDPASVEARAIAFLATLPPSIQGSNGSADLKRATYHICWGFALGTARGCEIILAHFNPRCQPEWSEREIMRACERSMDGTGGKPRGWHLEESVPRRSPAVAATPAGVSASGSGSAHVPDDIAAAVSEVSNHGSNLGNNIGAGGIDPPDDNSTDPNPAADLPPVAGIDDDDPSRLANLFLEQYRDAQRRYTLAYWREDFATYANGTYTPISAEDIRGQVVAFTEDELDRVHRLHIADWEKSFEKGDPKSVSKQPRRKHVTSFLINNMLLGIRRRVIMSSSRTPPFWIEGDHAGDNPCELIAMRNGVVHLPTLASGIGDPFTPATPRYFNLNATDYDFTPKPKTPTKWPRFLQSLWPDDQSSILALQEWFGYLLTPDTSRQKMLLIIGPPRAGKGTIGKVLRRLVGEANIAAPKLSSLADKFGLEDMIGKSVAMIADARLSGRADSVAVTESLLSISGEDPQRIDRKNKSAVTTRLNARFVIFSNELPRLGDSSGAIMSRLIVLRLTQSFLGEEDETLADQLIEELPGIFHWACDGWKRLQANRRFTQPESAQELIQQARDIVSPVSRFVEDRCAVGPGCSVLTKDLYREWKRWCEEHGYQHSSDAVFGRDLHSAFPKIQKQRLREGSSRNMVYAGIRALSAVEAGDYGE